MLVISFITHKGGAGKTTLASSMAVAAQEAGEKVALLDLDPQGATLSWAETRGHIDPFVFSTAPHELSLRIEELHYAGYTLCVLDTSADLAGCELAIDASDLCIVPSRPNTFDLRAGAITWRKIQLQGKAGAFLLNQCPPMRQSARNQEASRALQESGALLSPMISARVDFQDAARAGLGVTEINSSGQAAREVRELWTSILAYGQTSATAAEAFVEEVLEAA